MLRKFSEQPIQQEEMVLQVDAENKPIGPIKRSIMVKEHLFHRTSYVYLYNSKKQLYVQKRTLTKDYMPGYFTISTGGVVQPGEEDYDNAIRELEEEMGVKGLDLNYHLRFKYVDQHTKVWGNVYSLKYDGPIKFQKEEVQSIHMWDRAELLKQINKNAQITSDSLVGYDLISEKLGI